MSDPAPVIVPVHLGCCPEPDRCLLCAPVEAATPDLVEGLRVHYAERAGDRPLVVRFFGGAPPTDALLAPVADLPVGVRVRPDLLTRAEARRLAARGVTEVELDALSFHRPALREAGRRYGPGWLREQAEGLTALGMRVGGVLAPGLPSSSHETSLADAATAATQWSFARLHPVLVLADSALRARHARGAYTPLTLGEAVTTCRSTADRLEAEGVEVRRIGLQPGPDGVGRAVAGPVHPALRELVEARRTLDVLRQRLAGVRGRDVTIRCAPADETRTRGPYNQHVRTLRAEHGLDALAVRPDPSLPRGQWLVEAAS